MNSSQSPRKVTPLFDACRELGAQFVDLAGWQVPQLFGKIEEEAAIARRSVALADGSASGKIVVEGKQAETTLQAGWAIPSLAPGQGVVLDSKTVYRLRADQFFIQLDPGSEQEAVKRLTRAVEKSGDTVVISDVTHGRADLLLIGPVSGQMLSRLCSLDFQASQFPDLNAKQSSVAKTRQLILRHDIRPPNGAIIPAFSIIGARSLAVYLWQAILEAGHDLNLAPIGQSALEIVRAGK